MSGELHHEERQGARGKLDRVELVIGIIRRLGAAEGKGVSNCFRMITCFLVLSHIVVHIAECGIRVACWLVVEFYGVIMLVRCCSILRQKEPRRWWLIRDPRRSFPATVEKVPLRRGNPEKNTNSPVGRHHNCTLSNASEGQDGKWETSGFLCTREGITQNSPPDPPASFGVSATEQQDKTTSIECTFRAADDAFARL